MDCRFTCALLTLWADCSFDATFFEGRPRCRLVPFGEPFDWLLACAAVADLAGLPRPALTRSPLVDAFLGVEPFAGRPRPLFDDEGFSAESK